MMSTKKLDFLTPPPCPDLEQIYTIKLTQPPYYVCFSMTPSYYL